MFSGQTTIRRVVARCPARTEPLVARARLGRLLRGVDLAPPGMPPRAVLVVRRVAAPRRVSLDGSRLRPEWERAAREEVARNWRRAVRPARGRVPADAEAVWFEDIGEWLAALGLAVERREVERHWCWQATAGTPAPASTSATLVRAWAASPRFLPATIVRLARWGETARVLGLLREAEAHTLLRVLAQEFDLGHAADTRAAFRDAPRDSSSTHTSPPPPRDTRAPHSSTDGHGASDRRRAPHDAREEPTPHDPAPPWRRWLAADGGGCERLHATTQRLLSYAAALFHAPAHARTRAYAAEVAAFAARARQVQAEPDAPPTTPRPARHARTRDDDAATRTRGPRPRDNDEARTTHDAHDAPRTERAAATHDAHARDEARRDEAATSSESSARRRARESEVAEPPVSTPLIDERAGDDAEESASAAAWGDREGHETKLGGVLFLLNFFIHLRLPECFDEDFQLSEHVTGWGLAEQVARALLAELHDKRAHERDPLWPVLARLDGRSEDEPPAVDLEIGDDYRIPARWLKHFVAHDAASLCLRFDGQRLLLEHKGGFPVAVQTVADEDAPSSVAARLVAGYRAQGVALEGLDEEVAKLDGRRRDETSVDDARAGDARTGFEKWSGWTLPFMKHVLARFLAEGEEALTGEELARVLLSKRGRLYATATHVDLVMPPGEVSLPVRRAGLDASPGWVRDLMRVVTFHYE